MVIRLALVFGLFASMVLSGKDKDVYLAVGDSIAFGYSPLIPSYPPINFKGYPEFIATAPGTDFVKEINIACPGETSASFSDATAPDNHCRDYKAAPAPASGDLLHVPYTITQLMETMQILQAEKKISLVTINLGGNDLLLLQFACSVNPATYAQCVTNGLPALLLAYSRNLSAILGAIRAKNGGNYKGTIVLLTQYSTDYRLPQSALQQTAITLVNSVATVVSLTFGVKVADGYLAFALASHKNNDDPCAAGLLIPVGSAPLTCNEHPSEAGQRLLANTVLRAIGK